MDDGYESSYGVSDCHDVGHDGRPFVLVASIRGPVMFDLCGEQFQKCLGVLPSMHRSIQTPQVTLKAPDIPRDTDYPRFLTLFGIAKPVQQVGDDRRDHQRFMEEMSRVIQDWNTHNRFNIFMQLKQGSMDGNQRRNNAKIDIFSLDPEMSSRMRMNVHEWVVASVARYRDGLELPRLQHHLRDLTNVPSYPAVCENGIGDAYKLNHRQQLLVQLPRRCSFVLSNAPAHVHTYMLAEGIPFVVQRDDECEWTYVRPFCAHVSLLEVGAGHVLNHPSLLECLRKEANDVVIRCNKHYEIYEYMVHVCWSSDRRGFRIISNKYDIPARVRTTLLENLAKLNTPASPDPTHAAAWRIDARKHILEGISYFD